MTERMPTGAPERHRGFSLLEVLVSMTILAIGLLGLAVLQMRTLQFNHDAYIRSQATVLAYDLMERMRTVDAATAAGYTAGAPTAACDVDATSVTNDLACWYAQLAARLPGGNGVITAAPGVPNQYNITIQWYERETDQTRNQSWTIQVI